MAQVVADTAVYSQNTAVTSHSVTLPANIAAGNLLLMFLVVNGNSTVITDPTGWSPLTTLDDDDQVVIYGRIADGSEGATATVTLGTAQRATAITWRVTGARNGLTTSEIAISSAVVASVATPNPPPLTPSWGSEENLWVAVSFWFDSNYVFSSYPTNYTVAQFNQNTGSSSNSNGIMIAGRLLTASSEDPGTFTVSSAAKQNATYTLAIRSLAATDVNADLDVTEDDDTLSASGGVHIQASLAATEANDVPSASGALQVTASAFITEQDDVGASTGTLSISGSVAVTEGDDVPSASGTVDVVGSLAVVEDDDTLSAQGLLGIEASLAITEDDDTLSALALMPIVYPRRGGIDEQEQEEFERRKRRWKDDLGRIVDRSWRIANGEIDPVTFQPIPPPDFSAVIDELKRQALALDQERATAFVAQQEQMQEEEAIAVLLLAA